MLTPQALPLRSGVFEHFAPQYPDTFIPDRPIYLSLKNHHSCEQLLYHQKPLINLQGD